MAYTTIDKGSSYFNTKLYTGTGASLAITGVGFKPDWVWTKGRSVAFSHYLFDSVRGVGKRIMSNSTSNEDTSIFGVSSFDSDGFTLGTDTGANNSGSTFVAWNWLGANTTVSNTSGSIISTVSANTTAGFSIVSYTGTGANATVGHGLGVAPDMIICKSRTQAQNWATYHSSLGNTKAVFLDGTGAATTSSSYWNNTSPTSTVFTVGNSGDVNYNAGTQISYCFKSIKGYSKFGSYTGNSSADGTFIYTGFKPAWVMIKNSTTAGDSWQLWDNKRLGYNVDNNPIFPNTSGAEGTSDISDILSNGFKIRTTASGFNTSGDTYIYACFAENPFVSSTGIPCTAR